MDINQLKLGFASYLRETKGDEDLKYDPTSDISIFQYAKEFKDYIQTKYSIDTNLVSMSISDILDLEIVNGKLVDPDKLEEEQDINGEKPIEEAENKGETQQSAPLPQDQDTPSSDGNVVIDESSLTDILNSLMEDELFSGTIDSDKNGEFSDEELSNFFNAISIYDGDGTNVSLEDILSAAEDISNNTFITKTTTNVEIQDNSPKNNFSDTDIPVSTGNIPANTNMNTQSISGSRNYTTAKTQKPTEQAPKNINDMNSEELEAELSKANSDLSEKENNLEAIQNGSDNVVAPLKEAMEQALSDYTTALDNEDTQEAKELAEITKQIEEHETQQRENEEQKQNCEDKIEIANKDIEHYDTVIQNCTNGISILDGQISALESQLNSVQDDPDNPETAANYRTYIQAQIDQAKSEKQKLEQEKTDAENAKSEAEIKLNNAKEELSNIENKITLSDEQLETLKTTQAELEATVFENNSNLEQMKQTYLEAKENYTTTRESEIARAKEEVITAQNYVEEVTNKLNEVRQKEYDEKYSVVEMSDLNSNDIFDNAIEWAKQFVGMDQNAMQQIFKQMGYPFHAGVWCGDFTRMVLLSQVGEDNLADWFKDCPNLAYCPTIQTSGKGHEITDWNEARPGDVVLFDWASDGRDGSADHVGIVIGYDPSTDTLITIEGNTSGSGGGSCVDIKNRKRSDIIGIYNTHKN